MNGHRKGSMSMRLRRAISLRTIQKRCATTQSVRHRFWDVFLQVVGANQRTSKDQPYSWLPKLQIMCTELSLPWTAAGWGDKINSFSKVPNFGKAVNSFIN